MQGLFSFLKGLGAARMAAMAAVTMALIAFFGFLIVRVTTPPMTTLFTDLSYEDSSAIIKDLERQGIPYEMKNDGAILNETLQSLGRKDVCVALQAASSWFRRSCEVNERTIQRVDRR